MSYGRILETGHYIWPDSEGIHFDDVYVPNDTINIFLARLNDNRLDEMQERIQNGRDLLKQKVIGDLYDKE